MREEQLGHVNHRGGGCRAPQRGGPDPRVRRNGDRSTAAADRPGDTADTARSRRRFHPRRAQWIAIARLDQRTSHRPQLLFRRPQGGPVQARMGDGPRDGRLTARALPQRPWRVPEVGRIVGVGDQCHAHIGRRHRRGTRPPRSDADLGRGLETGHLPRPD